MSVALCSSTASLASPRSRPASSCEASSSDASSVRARRVALSSRCARLCGRIGRRARRHRRWTERLVGRLGVVRPARAPRATSGCAADTASARPTRGGSSPPSPAHARDSLGVAQVGMVAASDRVATRAARRASPRRVAPCARARSFGGAPPARRSAAARAAPPSDGTRCHELALRCRTLGEPMQIAREQIVRRRARVASREARGLREREQAIARGRVVEPRARVELRRESDVVGR